MSSRVRTLVCVWAAGVLFITAVLYRIPWLFILGALFDWLPIPMGWMKIGGLGRRVRRNGVVHGSTTILAYVAGLTWLLNPVSNSIDVGHLFLVLWFTAVILGFYASQATVQATVSREHATGSR